MDQAGVNEKSGDQSAQENASPSHRIRLPGFIADEDVGLGDVIKRVTHAFGIKACGGCERRAAALNRWFVFTGRASNKGPRTHFELEENYGTQ